VVADRVEVEVVFLVDFLLLADRVEVEVEVDPDLPEEC
jgi:hypothetical protein